MRVYKGYARDTSDYGGEGGVFVEDGNVVERLNHFVKHSPDGFSWGYAGSGPAELARCLLIDALQERAICQTCGGQGRVSYLEDDKEVPPLPGDKATGRCMDCEDGIAVMPAAYQVFKFEVIAKIPQGEGWTLLQSEIVDWYDEHATGRSDEKEE